jgi:hypothetical protein
MGRRLVGGRKQQWQSPVSERERDRRERADSGARADLEELGYRIRHWECETVARWAYNSPHTAIYFENEAGELWAFEDAAPAQLLSLRITGYTFEPGDSVTVVICPLRDGRHGSAIG